MESGFGKWGLSAGGGLLVAALAIAFIFLDVKSSWMEAQLLPKVARHARLFSTGAPTC